MKIKIDHIINLVNEVKNPELLRYSATPLTAKSRSEIHV